ncbi:hypothetical protein KDL44_01985 [bacterium]|nr:hypothetical protein [bacterium]
MKNFIVLVALGLLALVSSCDTLNIGSGQPQRLSIELSAPTGTGTNAPGLFGQETATFSATIIGVNGPFNISWNFGGAATNTTSTLAVAGTSTVSVTFVDLATATDFTATATVTDANGTSSTDSVTFNVGPTQNQNPTIDSLTFAGGTISVTGSDPDGDSLTFTAALDSGDVTVGGASATTATSAQFGVSPNDILAGGNFTVTVTADDGKGGTASDSVSGSFDAFPLADDTLYAIATSSSTSAGNNVRIVIATGDTANSFQYLNGCGVVCENGASYAATSFDVGTPDDTPDVGSANPIDGVWGDMGATSFLLAPDNFITGTDLGDGTSRTDFNVTPLGGSDITANGLLFNFEYTFASAGTYTLGFEAVNVVSRTYYQDSSAATDFFWGDIANSHAFNTITVN